MATFVKAQVASLSASIIDFLTTLVCTQVFHVWYVLGSVIGTTAGGMVNFMMGRNWVFGAKERNINHQIFKYIIVWVGNLLLTTAGVYLVTHYLHVNYILSKIIVSCTVGIGYNFLMQKKFVFI
ncbi:putative flippase GtrA [Pedobacter cryoconitis]|uniref:Putative flippase GtrA n=1 Tax=Pedobacter cryoconitis TaxID=188932 RepID=A0A7W8ZQ48_9SPHI|nr:GtrA family protein [Pedobacter cryoconitis]MBB5637877.1 putative flippase GtrA [Pedobacter cryoconitis]MBB6270367.1 putative flippase GtrA [Pedobacter cryoconitis]